MEVIYSAAHAEFPDSEPLGGGKAVADYLIREWQNRQPFALRVLSPRGLRGVAAVLRTAEEGHGAERRFTEAPLHQMSELQYARFCREFERTVTARILEHASASCVVLSNDVSEGPDFRVLGEHGYRIVTIFHVDVVEYFTRFYLRGWLKPQTAARWLDQPWMPDVLRLVFEKQRECVRHSARIVVPSSPMKEMILRCYPWCEPGKIAVLPWGNVAEMGKWKDGRLEGWRNAGPGIENQTDRPLFQSSSLPVFQADEFVIMTLSRLSPEKGIERLLRALPLVRGKCRVLICGAPAYMKGRRYERKLRRMANGRVEFLGHVTGQRKAALLQRADLFVSPSLHESYGLAIAEAEAAGCRIISHNHYGASGTVVDCGDRRALADAINRMIAAGRTRKEPRPVSSSTAAEKLAELLVSLA